jgi:hypothetical protein
MYLATYRAILRLFVILATIRADATVAAEIDCFCDSTVFTLVCEEATTLILAGQHLVDFVDFDIAEVIFFRKDSGDNNCRC